VLLAAVELAGGVLLDWKAK